ncbi:hypothetical protein [Candidatus Villigracilis affinis]|uniref:hypothetical protein n=1 Tax=Candidatus Villigracilis affinis TaxID=3140682 RepID=UPI0031E7E242
MGMDIMDMMNDMPLVSVLMFQQSVLPMPAEEMVAGLLMQAHKYGIIAKIGVEGQKQPSTPIFLQIDIGS